MQFLPPQNKDEVMAYLPKEHSETSGCKGIINPSNRWLQQEEMKSAQKEQHCLTSLPSSLTAFQSGSEKPLVLQWRWHYL